MPELLGRSPTEPEIVNRAWNKIGNEFMDSTQLRNAYREFLLSTQAATESTALRAELSAPLFVKIPDNWEESSLRVIYFGQETKGWGMNRRYHSRYHDFLGDGPCPFGEENLLSLEKTIQRPDAVALLEHVY